MVKTSVNQFEIIFFRFTFLLLGFFSILTQTIFLREIILTLYGHEFFIGIVLSAWLIWVAVGSLFSQKFSNFQNFKIFSILPFIISLLLFGEILLARYIKPFLGFAGEIPNLLNGFLLGIFLPLPVCFLLGSWWTLATKYFKKEKIFSVNLGYLWETFGFIIGGVLFTYLLIYFPAFLIIFLLAFFSLLFVFSFRISSFSKITFLIFILIVIFSLILKVAQNLEIKTQSFRFKNQKLIETLNSKYGNLSITKIKEQINFYHNGQLLASTKIQEIIETNIHFPLLSHKNPKKILLIGGAINGVLNQALKHSIESIYYLELDPKLIEISQRYLEDDFKKDFQDPRVKLIFQDGFYFLKNTNQKFDLVILNLPQPSNLFLNRFYTKEFFGIVKEKLKNGGIFAFILPYSQTSPNKNLYLLNALIYHSLKENFEDVEILSEYSNLFLASNKKINLDLATLSQRFKERNLKTKFFSENYLKYRLTSERNSLTKQSFEKTKKSNSLLLPLSYFYQTIFWLDRQNPLAGEIFLKFASFVPWILLILFGFLIFRLFSKKEKQNQKVSCFSMEIAGFSIMTSEIILLLLFQSSIGYLYTKISLIISSIMLGIALGVFHKNKILQKIKSQNVFKLLFTSHLLFVIFGLFLLLLFSYLFILPRVLVEFLIIILGIAAGYLGGSIFPLANKIYLEHQKEKTGTIYSADLLGSSLGTILPSLILIPLFGFFSAIITIIFTNFSLLFLIKHKTSQKLLGRL